MPIELKPVEQLTDKEPSLSEKEFCNIVNYAVDNFKGELPKLESAIGMLAIGRRFGWKVMYLIHTKKTIAEFEAILNIKIRDVLDDVSNKTHKSYAWILLDKVKKVKNYWKAVKGEIKGVRSTKTIEKDDYL